MPIIPLSGQVLHEIQRTGPPIEGKHLVGISVVALRVDTGQFRSRDLSRRREGIVALTVGGQESVFTFSGKGLIEVNCHAQLAYLGTNPGDLAVSVRVIELDQAVREGLARGGELAEMAAKVIGGLSIPFTETGLQMASALVKLLSKLADDDDEVAAFTVAEGAFGDESRVMLDIGTGDQPKVRLELLIRDFGKRQTLRMAGVRLTEPWIEFGAQRISQREKANSGKGYRTRRLTVRSWLVRNRQLRNLVFSARSGRHQAGIVSKFAGVDDVFHWRNWELFRVASARAADRHVIPLSLGFSLNSNSNLVEPLVDLVRAAADVAEEADPQYEQTTKIVHKAGRGLVDLISEIGDRELPLFQFDGALLLLPEGVAARGGVLGGTLELGRDPDGLWRGELTCEFRKWKAKPLGKIGFGIEVVGY